MKPLVFIFLGLFLCPYSLWAEGNQLSEVVSGALEAQDGIYHGLVIKDGEEAKPATTCQVSIDETDKKVSLYLDFGLTASTKSVAFLELLKKDKRLFLNKDFPKDAKDNSLELSKTSSGYSLKLFFSTTGQLDSTKNGSSLTKANEVRELIFDNKLNVRNLTVTRGSKSVSCQISNSSSKLSAEADLMEVLYSYHPAKIDTLSSQTNESTRRYLVDSAQHELLIAYYIVREETDHAGNDFIARLMRAALERKVKVKIILDGIGFNQMSVSTKTQKMMDLLGMEFKVWRPPLELKIQRRMHDKLLISDRSKMMIGSSNVWDAHAQGWLWNKDIIVESSNEVARAVNHFHSFLESSETSSGEKVTLAEPEVTLSDVQQYIDKNLSSDDAKKFRLYPQKNETFNLQHTRYVHDSPIKDKFSGTSGAILNLIKSANDSIDMILIYPMLADRFKTELLKAKFKRGVKIRILMPHPKEILSGEHSSLYGAFLSQLPFFDLLKANVFQFAGTRERKKFLHAKYIIVDGRKTYLGSSNFDELGANRNTENGLLTIEPKKLAPYAQSLQNDFEDLIYNEENSVSEVYRNGMRVSQYSDCPSVGCGMWKLYYSDLSTDLNNLLSTESDLIELTGR